MLSKLSVRETEVPHESLYSSDASSDVSSDAPRHESSRSRE